MRGLGDVVRAQGLNRMDAFRVLPDAQPVCWLFDSYMDVSRDIWVCYMTSACLSYVAVRVYALDSLGVSHLCYMTVASVKQLPSLLHKQLTCGFHTPWLRITYGGSCLMPSQCLAHLIC